MRYTLGIFLIALTMFLPASGQAHGIFGHVHVTGWAIENLPEGELAEFFDDPEVMNAALFGAAFTDSGYWLRNPAMEVPARAYTEHTHWEPFVEDYVQWMIVNDPPPWTDLESRRRVAFLMGCASHGLQDEIFDSLFLDQMAVHDNAGQEEADPGTDGFLAQDGHLRFWPDRYVPMETVLMLYADLPEQVTEEVVDQAVDTMTFFYLSPAVGVGVAETYGEQYRPLIPWAADHYLDMEVAGSLRAEILPTAAYMQAIWDRLHQQPSDPVIWSYPSPPRRLPSSVSGSPDSRVTLIFGVGVDYSSTVSGWRDDLDASVPFTQRNTRWGRPESRLIRLDPDVSLDPGAWYEAHLDAADFVDGSSLAAPFVLRFQVACAVPGDPMCPDVGPLTVPSIDAPPVPPMEVDAVEAMEPGSDVADPGPVDTGVADTPDTLEQRVEAPDSSDIVEPAMESSDTGCGCRTAGSTGVPWWTGLLALLMIGGLRLSRGRAVESALRPGSRAA